MGTNRRSDLQGEERSVDCSEAEPRFIPVSRDSRLWCFAGIPGDGSRTSAPNHLVQSYQKVANYRGLVDYYQVSVSRTATEQMIAPHVLGHRSAAAKYRLGTYVPHGYVLPLGDNRDNSQDGRYFGPRTPFHGHRPGLVQVLAFESSRRRFLTHSMLDYIDPSQSYSLYVHIPFCGRKCDYCAFYSEVPSSKGIMGALSDQLESELALLVDHLRVPFDTIYFGGGDPGMLPIDTLVRLLSLSQKRGKAAKQPWR